MNISDFSKSGGYFAPTLDVVEHVNKFLLSLVQRDEKEYSSSDSVCKSDEHSEVQSEWFTTKFLNNIMFFGIPTTSLDLKLDVQLC
ncbi:PIF1-like helicase [Medicago truncatula]|uniref:PIF1-like helicase n=1 Tax=Medicago truncatula TaxID=3880 RepID=A0A072UUG3_MEDTR|nr:PIF1-like helicase [Medicago truncatula]